MPVNVIIFDDNKERLESLKMLINLQQDMTCAGTFKNCLNVLEDIKSTKADVVLMDIDMPTLSGIEGVKKIRQSNNNIYIIMQTVFDDTDKIFAAIEAGADGYFLKTTPTSKLLEGIRDVLEGVAPMTATVAKQVLSKFKKQPTPSQAKQDVDLNEMERTILGHLVNGLSYKMIADQAQISYSTVNMYIKRIYKKLQVNSAPEAISKVLKNRILSLLFM